MARYRIVHWKDIPSLVEAADADRTVRHQLSQKFQDLIDALAMRENATEGDAMTAPASSAHGSGGRAPGKPDAP